MDNRRIDDADVERFERLFRDLSPLEIVDITYDSNRGGDVTVTGSKRPDSDHEEDKPLRIKTADRKGDVYIWRSHDRYGNVVFDVHSTGSRFTNRQPRMGRLIDIERRLD